MRSYAPSLKGRNLCAIGRVVGAASFIGQACAGLVQAAEVNAAHTTVVSHDATDAPSAETHFSNLREISADSVGRLKLAFSFRTGSPRGHAGSPRVSGRTAYVLTPFPHTLFALDLEASSTRRVKWTYRPEPDRRAEGLTTTGATNYGPTVVDGRVYINTLDGRTAALDADSGQVAWNVATADLSRGETLTSAPLASKGRVLVGNAGDDFGARGWIAALDARDGRELWRRYSTGPDADVGISSDFEPLTPSDRGRDLGLTSWPPSQWAHGGGGVSGALLYDSATGFVIGGTGHPAPRNAEQRPGVNRWTSGLFARDIETGSLRWFTAINPRDPFSYGATAPNLMVDRDWNGTLRHLLVHPDANGTLYVLDRGTGAILSASAFAPANATTGVDRATGRVEPNAAKPVRINKVTRDVCPAASGAAMGAAAYSAQTGLVYVPVSRLCMDIEARQANYIAGTPFTGSNMRLKPPLEGTRGALVGWDLAAGKPAWTVWEEFPLVGGVLATAGGLVLYGTLDGSLKVVDARSGRELWRTSVSSGIIGQPTTFLGPNGHQYVAVLAGLGGALGEAARSGIDVRDASALDGAGNALRDLPKPKDESGTLYVFGLP